MRTRIARRRHQKVVPFGAIECPDDEQVREALNVLEAGLQFRADLEHSLRFESLIWEAPTKESQAWFIKHFGTNVNLGNIPPDEVIPLETLRLGLRGDTLKEVLLGGEPATTG